jgi:hypothetical protein
MKVSHILRSITPPVVGALLLALLISLGFWQLDRAAEKRALAEEFERAAPEAPAVVESPEALRDLPRFHAVDKRTGERLGTIDIPAPTSTAPMTFLHDGVQFIVLPVAGDGLPGSLVALRLPGG